jgi:hypothetical protein
MSADTELLQPYLFKVPAVLPHVYSCFVVNCTAQLIDCTALYNGRPGEDKFNEEVQVSIPGNSETFFPRKIFQPELPDSFCKWVKIIVYIKVKRHDGKTLEVHYPFDNVNYPVRNWEFHVKENGDILSKSPTRPVNVLKYEGLDEHEQ